MIFEWPVRQACALGRRRAPRAPCAPQRPQKEVGEPALSSIKNAKWRIAVNHTKQFDGIFNLISETKWSLN
jgi:hypothetical protein